jgi:hypothetical protein
MDAINMTPPREQPGEEQPDYKPPRETVALIAEFLSLTFHLDATPHQELAAARQRKIEVLRTLMCAPSSATAESLHREVADLDAAERRLKADAQAMRADLIRTNQLALRLAMELPIALWRAVAHGAASPNVEGRYAAVDAVRDALGSFGQITGAEYFWAAPGVGVAQAGPPPPHSP